MSRLESRQWALYAYLKERGDQWSKQEDIAKDLFEWYPFADGYFHDSKARLQMTMDIRAINDNATIQKIIISSSNGIKLANEEEFNRYIRSEYKSVFKKLMRIRTKERKGKLDGQTQFNFSGFEQIEAFLREV